VYPLEQVPEQAVLWRVEHVFATACAVVFCVTVWLSSRISRV